MGRFKEVSMFFGLLLSLFLDRELVFRGEGRAYRERPAVVAAAEPSPAVADGGTPIPPKP